MQASKMGSNKRLSVTAYTVQVVIRAQEMEKRETNQTNYNHRLTEGSTSVQGGENRQQKGLG